MLLQEEKFGMDSTGLPFVRDDLKVLGAVDCCHETLLSTDDVRHSWLVVEDA